MKTLFLDCGMGAAGDMLTAALYELLPEEERAAFVEEMNKVGIPGVKVSALREVKSGIVGTRMEVKIHGIEEKAGDEGHVHVSEADAALEADRLQTHVHVHDDEEHEHHHHHHDDEEHEHHHHHHDDEEHEHHHHHHDDEEHEHHHHHHDDEEHEHHHDHHDHEEHGHHHHHHEHHGMADIQKIIASLAVSDQVKKDITEVYAIVAEAESTVHGTSVSEIHFHEVGMMDAIADITAVCLLMEKLGIEKVLASPVCTGYGHVRCAHGILPVPAPATAVILRGIPVYAGNVEGELLTPTGAALLKHFVKQFGEMPLMTLEATGYGMGKKEFSKANCVRALLGNTTEETDMVSQLSCNVDDMSGEDLGFAMERLFAAGAYDVFTIPVGMKKSRPGVLLRVICDVDDREKMVGTLYRYTTTIGVREVLTKRFVLERHLETRTTPYGNVRVKVSEGYGAHKEKLEYDDLAELARQKGLSLAQVRKLVEEALS